MLESAISEIVFRAMGEQAYMAPAAYECIVREANKQQISQLLAFSLLREESGSVGLERQNSNGTFDLGPMQINTVHLNDFARMTGMTEYQVRWSLKNDPCANASAAMWLLRKAINRAGDVWGGVAQYHSRTPANGTPYAWRVHHRMMTIYQKLSYEAKSAVLLPYGALASTAPTPGNYPMSQSAQKLASN